MIVGEAYERIGDLMASTSGSKVHATVTVDQIYAQIQHEALEFRHPRGGIAKYLTVPLMADHPKWLLNFAEGLLDTQDAAHRWGSKVGVRLQQSVEKYAPVEFYDLRRSAALDVRTGGYQVMYRPAEQPRLTEAELQQKDIWRQAGLTPG